MAFVKRLLGRAARKWLENESNFDSAKYWESRYANNGTSGAGSYGHLAKFKADFLNRFVEDHGLTKIIELGCGDGNQLSLAKYPNYFGYDVSETAVSRCHRLFGNDNTKTFSTMLPQNETFDLSLSLDVIFHLIEDDVFDQYMNNLFSLSARFTIIYSSNLSQSAFDARFGDRCKTAPHVKHRCFTDWVSINRKEWHLIETKENPFVFDPLQPENTSFSEFYIFELVKPCTSGRNEGAQNVR